MSSLTRPVLEAFQAELKKFSFALKAPANLSSMLGGAGALGGVGALGGGILGAGVGSVKNYRAAKHEGATSREAVMSGLGGALGGAQRGALTGGVLGAATGAGLGHLSPEKAEHLRESLTKGPMGVGAFARSGQRQVHGVTGWAPKGGVREIGLGAVTREPQVAAAKAALEEAKAGRGGRSLTDRVMRRTSVEGATKRLGGAQKGLEAATTAEKMGLTSIPGYVKSLASRDPDRGVGKTLAAAAKSEWHGGDPVSRAMMIGLPAAGAIGALRGPEEDPNHPGQGKAQRVAGQLVMGATGALLSPMAIGTQSLVGGGLHRAGDAAGREVDRLRHSSALRPRAPDLTADSGQAVPGERVVSERAAAMGGEGSPS